MKYLKMSQRHATQDPLFKHLTIQFTALDANEDNFKRNNIVTLPDTLH
jgi:hypothetical protein